MQRTAAETREKALDLERWDFEMVKSAAAISI